MRGATARQHNKGAASSQPLRCVGGAWKCRHRSVGGASGASPLDGRGVRGASLLRERGVSTALELCHCCRCAAATQRGRGVTAAWEQRERGVIAAREGHQHAWGRHRGIGGASQQRGISVLSLSTHSDTQACVDAQALFCPCRGTSFG